MLSSCPALQPKASPFESVGTIIAVVLLPMPWSISGARRGCPASRCGDRLHVEPGRQILDVEGEVQLGTGRSTGGKHGSPCSTASDHAPLKELRGSTEP